MARKKKVDLKKKILCFHCKKHYQFDTLLDVKILEGVSVKMCKECKKDYQRR